MNKIEDINFNITNFEGPLDLLLYLISKNKKSIFDISLSELTDSYIEYLHKMDEENIEIASEFVVMASTLLEIKARKLLPELEDDEEDEDYVSEEELLRRINEYKKYKEISATVYDLYTSNFGSFVKSMEKIKFKNKVKYTGDSFTKEDVFANYKNILLRNQNKINKNAEEIEKIAVYEKYTVQDKVKQIVNYLNDNNKMVFNKMYNNCSNIETVTAFLGVLELGKMKQVDIEQNYLFSDINVTKLNKDKIDINIDRIEF